jgi:ureidoglycolate hydrolase
LESRGFIPLTHPGFEITVCDHDQGHDITVFDVFRCSQNHNAVAIETALAALYRDSSQYQKL